MSKENTQEGMEERFDTQFVLKDFDTGDSGRRFLIGEEMRDPVYPNDVRDFIRQEVALAVRAREEKLRVAIGQLMKDERPMEDGFPVETYGYEETHNRALIDVLALLKPKQEI